MQKQMRELKQARWFSTRDRSERGATVVEFALVFVLFVVVIVALMELGRGMWTYATIAHATRQAGRYCMVRGSASPASLTEVRSIVERNCAGLETSQITLNMKWNPDAATPITDPTAVSRGDVVQVRVQYPFQLVTGRLILAQSTLPMSSTTRMIVAN